MTAAGYPGFMLIGAVAIIMVIPVMIHVVYTYGWAITHVVLIVTRGYGLDEPHPDDPKFTNTPRCTHMTDKWRSCQPCKDISTEANVEWIAWMEAN